MFSRKIEAGISFPDHEAARVPKKEQVQFYPVDVITISGERGAGNSSVARALYKRLKEEGYTVGLIKIGDKLRAKVERETGQEIVDYAKRRVAVDRKLDDITMKIMENAKRKNEQKEQKGKSKGVVYIIDAKLAGWIAHKVRQGNPSKIASFYLTASEDIRTARIMNRENEKKRAKGEAELTSEEAKVFTKSRREKDQRHWERVHPDLDFNPLDAEIDKKAKILYNRIIDTGNQTPEEIAFYIDQCIRFGNLWRKEETRLGSLKLRGNIGTIFDRSLISTNPNEEQVKQQESA